MNLEAIRTVLYGQSGDDFVDRSKVNIKNLEDVEYWTLEVPKPNSKTLVFESSDPSDLQYADGLNQDYAFDAGVADEGEDWRPYFSPPSIFYTIDRNTKAAQKVLERIASGEKTLDWRG
tara:strand:- start:791 stop:1147 length:357 start_codon:yes stop_codon:yes gene_type:complete